MAITGLAVFGSFMSSAKAVDYIFNKYSGNVYILTGEVYKNDIGGVTATARVNMPTCNNSSRLKGYITFNFKSEDGGYFSNYTYDVLGKEGRNNVEAFVNVPYLMSDRGILTLVDNTFCESF
ncbi:hypothetical protein GM3709_2774 [Geminocystis sp. NIES-3709]|nr:hypothetical protein GM3709_2774 [Geminocystis sp. NIES-3709]